MKMDQRGSDWRRDSPAPDRRAIEANSELAGYAFGWDAAVTSKGDGISKNSPRINTEGAIPTI